jgi:L-rhamnose mutarotase
MIRKNLAAKIRVNAAYCKIAKIIGNYVTKDTLYKQLDCWHRLFLELKKKYGIRVYSRALRQNKDLLFIVAEARAKGKHGLLRELEEMAEELFSKPLGAKNEHKESSKPSDS